MDTIISLACCDCGTPCAIRFCLLTSDDQIVYMTACKKCDDHKTIRFFDKIPHDAWVVASSRVPVVAFTRRAA